ncbi:Fic family protein [Candidatus Woesearchaeota archaeon]|nr:Fic family protein [Candidatus Woesearchaeota archaeon]
MEYVGRELLTTIDELKGVLDSHELAALVRHTIELEANSHSDRMEHPPVIYSVKKRDGKRIQKARPMKQGELRRFAHNNQCKTLHMLNATWDWAVLQYNGTLDHELIQDIAYKIEPTAWGYRRANVRISGHDVVLPQRWEKVRDSMCQLIDEINDSRTHPIDRAISAHLHIARVHPFADGNGRTARLVQNLILHAHHYTPPVIRTNERLAYQILLRTAMVGYRDRTSDGREHSEPSAHEIIFFDLMADNIRRTMQRAIGESDPNPAYHIDLRFKERSQVHVTKKILDSYLRINNLGIAQLHDARNGRISVRGTLSSGQLDDILSRCPVSAYCIRPK